MKPTIMAALAVFAAMSAPAAAEPIELQWWHAMTAVNGERINKIASDFNALQSDYKVVPVFKGSYAETMTAAIAAYRAGNPPDIVQVFEVGTATMTRLMPRSTNKSHAGFNQTRRLLTDLRASA